MDITISTEQESALTRSNEQANPNPNTRPTLQEFVQGIFNAKAAEHVKAWADRDALAVKATLEKKIVTMTEADKAALLAITSKYDLPTPAEVVLVQIVNEEDKTDGVEAVPYSFQVIATGTPPIRYTAKGLPEGLACAVDTGIISGAPKTAGIYPVTLIAENDVPSNDRHVLTLTVVKA